MKRNTDEKGYALIIVLFSIIFITVITAVFMRGSLSNIKQEHRVDESNLTVTAAEAGVDYYSWEFKKEYQKNKATLIAFAEDLEKKQSGKDKTPNYPDIQNKTALELKSILEKKRIELIKKNYELFDYTHQLYLQSNDITIIPLTEEDKEDKNPIYLMINGKVKGEHAGEYNVMKDLTFQQKFIIPTLEKGSTTGDVGVGDIIDVPSWIEKNKPTKSCVNESKIKNDCYANTKNNLDKLEEVIKRAYVYKQGDINTKKDLELDKGYMFVSGTLDVKEELELESGSQLFVGKDLFVRKKDELELEDASYLFVQGNADISGDVEIDDGSYFYVGKDAIIHKEIEIEGSSKKKGSTMHVGGKLTFLKEIEMEDSTNLYVGGLLTSNGNSTKIELEDNAKICADSIDLENTSISMEKNTRIYHLGVVKLNKKVLKKHSDKIIKVADSIELKKMCSVSTDLPSGGGSTTTPDNDGSDRWEDPIIESVTY